jgi:diguanylate cyclase (GGDEF)-like protein
MLACALATCPPLVSPLRDIAERMRIALSADPDQALVRARGASERLVAAVRLAIISLLVVSNIAFSITNGSFSILTMGMAAGGLLYGGVMFLLPRRISAPWLPWVVSTIDVSFATAVLSLAVMFNEPLAALNNRVVYDTYFVAVTIAALRFDWRLCAFTTLLVIAEFLGLASYVFTHWDVGTIESATHGRFFPVQFANRLLVLAGHGAATIAVAMWARHLRLMIGTDQLTGLLQRRPFLERIEEELARADVSRTTLSVAIFDIDDFKRYNDELGHLEGDRALQRIGEQIRKAVRTTDLVARYGGEEFVVAFPRMDVQLAARRADALRAEIAALVLRDGRFLTISGGVASWPADGATFEAVLKKADERLYAAKNSGRNIVIGPLPVPLRSAGELGV